MSAGTRSRAMTAQAPLRCYNMYKYGAKQEEKGEKLMTISDMDGYIDNRLNIKQRMLVNALNHVC